MPLTVASLLRMCGLSLRLAAGQAGTERSIDWVHVSELYDPTPFLEGGELLLITGLALPDDASAQRELVRRLSEVGVAGLGFGTGLSHATVPEPLCAAAEPLGMPVIEVPRQTPFIAISKAVAKAKAADDYAAITRVHDADQALIRAAFGKSPLEALVGQLARKVGWAILFDPSGAAVHAVPASAAVRVGTLRADIRRLHGRATPTSVGLTLDGDTVVVQSLVSDGRTRGFLAAGRAGPLAAPERHIINAAASILTLVLGQTSPLEDAQLHLRTGILRLLLAGQAETVRQPVRDLWGALPPEPLRVVVLDGATPVRAATDLLDGRARDSEPMFYAELDDTLVVLLTDGPALDALLSQVTERTPGVTLGISEPVGYPGLAEGHQQAVQAAERAIQEGRRIGWFRDVVGGGVLGLIGAQHATAYAAALLDPLIRHDAAGRGALVESLRAWLEHHGQWDPAASRLGVHRHTLRHRIGRVETLLGRSLDSPTLRAELWLALQMLGTPPSHRPCRDSRPLQ